MIFRNYATFLSILMPQFLLRMPFAVVVCTFFSFVLFVLRISVQFEKPPDSVGWNWFSPVAMALLLSIFFGPFWVYMGILLGLIPAKLLESVKLNIAFALLASLIITAALFALASLSNEPWHGRQNKFVAFLDFVAEQSIAGIGTLLLVRWIFLKDGLRGILSNKI